MEEFPPIPRADIRSFSLPYIRAFEVIGFDPRRPEIICSINKNPKMPNLQGLVPRREVRDTKTTLFLWETNIRPINFSTLAITINPFPQETYEFPFYNLQNLDREAKITSPKDL